MTCTKHRIITLSGLLAFQFGWWCVRQVQPKKGLLLADQHNSQFPSLLPHREHCIWRLCEVHYWGSREQQTAQGADIDLKCPGKAPLARDVFGRKLRESVPRGDS